MGNRIILLAAVFVTTLALASATAFFGESKRAFSREAEFIVQDITCAACVSNVQRALSAVDGVGKANVNVLTGRMRVEFDPARIDVERIAAVVTRAGYRAFPQNAVSLEALQELQSEAQRLSADYVGRIGGRLVSRADFDHEVETLRATLPPQHAQMPLESIKLLVWENVVQRETLLGEADRRSLIIQDDEVAAELEEMRAEIPDFQAFTEQFGGQEQISRRIREGLLIERLVQEQMSQGGLPRDQARMNLERWYRNLSENTAVEVFDPALRSANAGCSCCG